MRNGYLNLRGRPTYMKGGRNQDNLAPRRDALDRYETPPGVTLALLKHVKFKGSILEPAAGTGRIARVLRAKNYHVETADIQRGKDFLKRRSPCANVVTNPPYFGQMPFLFAKKALEISNGTVAMLVKHGFLWSKGRHRWLVENPPTTLIFCSDRILFLDPDGKQIDGQFFDHVWVVWERHVGRQRFFFERVTDV